MDTGYGYSKNLISVPLRVRKSPSPWCQDEERLVSWICRRAQTAGAYSRPSKLPVHGDSSEWGLQLHPSKGKEKVQDSACMQFGSLRSHGLRNNQADRQFEPVNGADPDILILYFYREYLSIFEKSVCVNSLQVEIWPRKARWDNRHGSRSGLPSPLVARLAVCRSVVVERHRFLLIGELAQRRLAIKYGILQQHVPSLRCIRATSPIGAVKCRDDDPSLHSTDSPHKQIYFKKKFWFSFLHLRSEEGGAQAMCSQD